MGDDNGSGFKVWPLLVPLWMSIIFRGVHDNNKQKEDPYYNLDINPNKPYITQLETAKVDLSAASKSMKNSEYESIHDARKNLSSAIEVLEEGDPNIIPSLPGWQSEIKEVYGSLPKNMREKVYQKVLDANSKRVYNIVDEMIKAQEELKLKGKQIYLEQKADSGASIVPSLILGLLSLIFMSAKFTGFAVSSQVLIMSNILGVIFFLLFLSHSYFYLKAKRIKNR